MASMAVNVTMAIRALLAITEIKEVSTIRAIRAIKNTKAIKTIRAIGATRAIRAIRSFHIKLNDDFFYSSLIFNQTPANSGSNFFFKYLTRLPRLAHMIVNVTEFW